MSYPVETHTPHVLLRVLLQVETHSASRRMRDIRHTDNCRVPPAPSTAGPVRRSSPSSLVRTHRRPPGTSTITGSDPLRPPCRPLWPCPRRSPRHADAQAAATTPVPHDRVSPT